MSQENGPFDVYNMHDLVTSIPPSSVPTIEMVNEAVERGKATLKQAIQEINQEESAAQADARKRLGPEWMEGTPIGSDKLSEEAIAAIQRAEDKLERGLEELDRGQPRHDPLTHLQPIFTISTPQDLFQG